VQCRSKENLSERAHWEVDSILAVKYWLSFLSDEATGKQQVGRRMSDPNSRPILPRGCMLSFLSFAIRIHVSDNKSVRVNHLPHLRRKGQETGHLDFLALTCNSQKMSSFKD